MDAKEILEFVYKIVQTMNGAIDILKKLHAVNDQKKSKTLYKKRANVCKTLTQRSERSTQSFTKK